jgi:hypothetical protein
MLNRGKFNSEFSMDAAGLLMADSTIEGREIDLADNRFPLY